MESRSWHPTDLDLELARTGEAHTETGRHLAECAECSQRMTMLRELSSALHHDPASVQVPEIVEARILRQARRAANRSRRAPRTRWVAVAAATILLVALTWVFRTSLTTRSISPQLTGETLLADVNDDGIVDILDAYHLAKRIESGAAVDTAWDLDENGRIDRRDADTLAMAVVRIGSEIRR